MKNKIVWRLSGYFVAALFIFSLIMSGIFIALFRTYTIELKKDELEQRAIKISETLSSVTTSGVENVKGEKYGTYMKFLNVNATSDVWIVDENLNIITYGMGRHLPSTTTELPADAKQIVDEIFTGKTEFSQSFSTLLDTPSLTVGTPIKSENGDIIGVVLLHSPVNGIDLAITNGIFILIISIGIALLIAVLFSVGLSFSFTKPLKRINLTAIQLIEGDYSVKTGITQKDEIGTLAGNMDILAKRLYEASKESDKLEGLRRDFVANISHELRTPVTVIHGSLEALNDGVVADEIQIKEYYAQMLSESKHLQRLISDLLDLSRLQNTDFQLKMSEVNLSDVLTDAIRSARSLAKEKNIDISFYNQAEKYDIFGDYGRLRQMIMIILDNAVKFSSEKGHIDIKLIKDKELVLSIRDKGPGIPQQDLPYIFDRFYKTKSEENKTGTGLGLAIAKQIAVRHNIKIEAVSEQNKGTEFIFKFIPLKENSKSNFSGI